MKIIDARTGYEEARGRKRTYTPYTREQYARRFLPKATLTTLALVILDEDQAILFERRRRYLTDKWYVVRLTANPAR